MLEIVVCDDNGKDLNAITEILYEICTEIKQECQRFKWQRMMI